MSNDLKATIKSIRRSYQDSAWWKYVQDDVKTSLEAIVENIGTLGIPFRDSFVSLFTFHHAIRTLSNKALPSTDQSPLFGELLPEECYLVGKLVAKTLLALNDWVDPNDADVYGCIVLCQQIDVLQAMGYLIPVEGSPSRDDILAKLKQSFRSDTNPFDKSSGVG